jgi:hypothetical protein
MSGSAKSLFTSAARTAATPQIPAPYVAHVFAQSVNGFLRFVAEHMQAIKGLAVSELDKECSIFTKCTLFKQSANQMI